jgi:hypothetical protein
MALGFTCIVACTAPEDENPATDPVGEGKHDADHGPPCTSSTNLIDQAACPHLRAASCASPPPAPTTELCRRLYVDLVGTIPTPAEVEATCAGKDARAIATTLMATPAYVRQQQELWGEILGYDATQINGKWLVDADAIVAQLVIGAMPYDTFAKRMLGHPVFGVGGRLPRSDLDNDDDRYFPQVARLATKVFLGRATIAGEDVALGNLFRFWKKKNVILNVNYGRTDPMINPFACPCQTSAFGVVTSIDLPLAEEVAYEDVANAMPPELRAELDKVGALFMTQDAFWTQAVDLAMHMFLGWWKDTRNLDESVLPEVQLALADWLRRSPARSWRDLVLEIVSSDLYVRSGRVMPGAPSDLRAWCTGPVRILRPEAYVSSLGKVLGVRVGRCDHRTVERRGLPLYPNGTEGSFYPEDQRADEDADPLLLGVIDYHWLASTSMGGCSAGAARSEDPTLTVVFGAAPVAQTICEASQRVVPIDKSAPLSDVTIAGIADHYSFLLRGRAATRAEQAAIAKDAARCTSCDARTIVVNTCASIARSIETMTY